MAYPSSSGKVLGSIIRQKMDEVVTSAFSLQSPYSCINQATQSSKDLNMKAWLANAMAIGEYIEGYMITSMKTQGAYVYLEQAVVPPPPPVLPAMGTISDKPTFGFAEAKDPYSILNIALPTMVFATTPTTEQKKAIVDNLTTIAIWLNAPPIPFSQKTLQQEENPIYALDGTGQIIFPDSFGKIDAIAEKIIAAMEEKGGQITFIDANDIFATGIVNMLNGLDDEGGESKNLVFSFDLGSVIPEATNKMPGLPGVYFGVSQGTVTFTDKYQSKVLALIPAPPLINSTLTMEIPLTEIDLSSIATAFIDAFFQEIDLDAIEKEEMKKNFGDVIRVTFNGLFEGGKVAFTELTSKVDAFIAKINERLSISALTTKLTKRMFNFSYNLQMKVLKWFNEKGWKIDDITKKVNEVIQQVFDIATLPDKIIQAVVTEVTNQITSFITSFAISVSQKIAIGSPMPAAAVIAALADKISKAISLILSLVETIKGIIDKVVAFATEVIGAMVALIEKINVFIEQITQWIAQVGEPCKSELAGLALAFAPLLAFGASNPSDAAPPPPSLPPEFAAATKVFYVTSGNYNTSGSMTPESDTSWNFLTNSATSGFGYMNNVGLMNDPSTTAMAIGVFSAQGGSSSLFVKDYNQFTVSGNPYVGSFSANNLVIELLAHPEFSSLIQSNHISAVTSTDQLDYTVFRIIEDKYNESTSAMEDDPNKRFFFGYFAKIQQNSIQYYKGWVWESLLNRVRGNELIVMVRKLGGNPQTG